MLYFCGACFGICYESVLVVLVSIFLHILFFCFRIPSTLSDNIVNLQVWRDLFTSLLPILAWLITYCKVITKERYFWQYLRLTLCQVHNNFCHNSFMTARFWAFFSACILLINKSLFILLAVLFHITYCFPGIASIVEEQFCTCIY